MPSSSRTEFFPIKKSPKMGIVDQFTTITLWIFFYNFVICLYLNYNAFNNLAIALLLSEILTPPTKALASNKRFH